MSASPIARQATQCQTIPSRSVVINDASQLPTDYSTTPGGTVYSTTPGGRPIVLLSCIGVIRIFPYLRLQFTAFLGETNETDYKNCIF
jgi:hypothetical protein